MQDIAFSKILTRKEVVLQIGRRVSTKVNTAGRVPVRVYYIYLSTFRFSFINCSFFPLYVLLFHHNYFGTNLSPFLLTPSCTDYANNVKKRINFTCILPHHVQVLSLHFQYYFFVIPSSIIVVFIITTSVSII